MNVYPINNDLVLFYGGITFRGNSKSICVFNITKSEVNKIQPKILETLTEIEKGQWDRNNTSSFIGEIEPCST